LTSPTRRSVDLTGQDAQHYGINVRDNPYAARAFECAFEIPYSACVKTTAQRCSWRSGEALTGLAVPITVVVDANGEVAARVVGHVDASTLIDPVDGASAPGP
jgi:hypothetical protein